MLHDYAFGRSTRRCRITDRVLQPGERYYSVVVPKGSEIARYEIADSAWQGPPAEAIGWWRSTVAKQTATKIIPTPIDELLELLTQLCEDEEQAPLANLLAVHLLRRRILHTSESPDSLEVDTSRFDLIHPPTNTRYRVPSVEPDLSSLTTLQSALQALLYREG